MVGMAEREQAKHRYAYEGVADLEVVTEMVYVIQRGLHTVSRQQGLTRQHAGTGVLQAALLAYV